jgi:hypothetical protein
MDPNFSSQTGAGPSNSLLMSDPCHTVFPIDFSQPHIHTDFVTVTHEIEVVKRRPGRPKGSGRKSLGADSPQPKIKRPVGRPRKDGFPAGSVSTRRSVRSRRDVPTTLDGDTSVPQACSAGQSCVPPAEVRLPMMPFQEKTAHRICSKFNSNLLQVLSRRGRMP